MGGCPLIRVCSLIRSNTVIVIMRRIYFLQPGNINDPYRNVYIRRNSTFRLLVFLPLRHLSATVTFTTIFCLSENKQFYLIELFHVIVTNIGQHLEKISIFLRRSSISIALVLHPSNLAVISTY